jgi:hypothetical protein
MKLFCLFIAGVLLIGCGSTNTQYVPVGGGYYNGGTTSDDHTIFYPDLSSPPGFFFGDGQGGGTLFPHGISEPPIQIY